MLRPHPGWPTLPRALPLVLACAALCAPPAGAVVITTGDGSGNTTAPPDDPGFANVGAKGASGVYLGNGWALTAVHAGVGPAGLQLGGVSYALVPDSEVQIYEDGTPTDLLLFQIQNPPALPSLAIAAAPMYLGAEVVMIGHGNDREPDLVYWDASWTEVGVEENWDYSGYNPIFNRTIRWGQNRVNVVGFVLTVGATENDEFCTGFDSPGISHEAQAAPGDSGGAVFLKRYDQWELAGMLDARFTIQGQPFNASVFGSFTCSVDLSVYRSEILAVTGLLAVNPVPVLPPPLLAPLALALVAAAGVALRPRRRAG